MQEKQSVGEKVRYSPWDSLAGRWLAGIRSLDQMISRELSSCTLYFAAVTSGRRKISIATFRPCSNSGRPPYPSPFITLSGHKTSMGNNIFRKEISLYVTLEHVIPSDN